MRCLLIIILSSFLTSGILAQKCDRPDQVFIQLNSLDSFNVLYCLRKSDARIYLQDSSEVFVRKSDIKKITETEYSKLEFHTVSDLRSEAGKIRRCEIKRADDTIYLDIDINSVFKEIYMVIVKDEVICKFQVHWIDGIE